MSEHGTSQAARGSIDRSWDVVVAGAGPAGAAAAIRAASHGVRTLLVDRVTFPRAKVCGCCLSPRGVSALDELGVGHDAARLGAAIDSAEIVSRRRMTQVPMRTGGLAIAREELDTLLVRAAASAGARVLEGVSATLVESDTNGATIMLGRESDAVRIHARCVIVADGLAGSFLPKSGVWESRVSRSSRIGIGGRIARPARGNSCVPRVGMVRMFCARGGYAGMVQLADGSVDVAAAVSPSHMRRCGGAAHTLSTLLCEALGNGADAQALQEALHGVRWHGTPKLTRRRDVEVGSILVAGDAASYTEPFTGEGMSWALRGGIAAGDLVSNLIHRRTAQGQWAKRYREMFGVQLRVSAVAAMCLRSPVIISAVLGVASGSPRFLRAVVDAMARSWGASVRLGGAT